MTTSMRRVPFLLALGLAWVGMSLWTSGAMAEKAAKAGKPDKKSIQKRAALRAAAKPDQAKKKASKGKEDAKPEPKKGKPKSKKGKGGGGGMLGGLKAKLRVPTGPIKIAKPIWNQKAGFGVPVPPGWSAKVEGPKIILTSPDPPIKQTKITMGPEPTEMEAAEYLSATLRTLAEKEKFLVLPRPPMDIADKTLHMGGYMDTRMQPAGFGGLLVLDRPGDQVFVIQVSTRDQSIIQNTVVLASLGMLRFRNEPPLDIMKLVGITKSEKLELNKLELKSGEATLSELHIPRIVRKLASEDNFKGDLHRYRLAVVTPKAYDMKRLWPVLILDAPPTRESIKPYLDLANELGVIVLAVGPKSEDTVWTATLKARMCFAALNRLCQDMTIDRTRVYVMGSGANGVKAQVLGVMMPLTRGVICHAAKADGVTGPLAKSPDAKTRLALAAAYTPKSKGVKQADVEALVAAWKKAGVASVQAFKKASDGDAIRGALKWLMKRDQDLIKAEMDKSLARAKEIAKTRSGEALTIYRRIIGSGLKGDQVKQAAQAVDALIKECAVIANQLTTQPTQGTPEQAIAKFAVMQRFQGTPEGAKLVYSMKVLLEAQ